MILKSDPIETLLFFIKHVFEKYVWHRHCNIIPGDSHNNGYLWAGREGDYNKKENSNVEKAFDNIAERNYLNSLLYML